MLLFIKHAGAQESKTLWHIQGRISGSLEEHHCRIRLFENIPKDFSFALGSAQRHIWDGKKEMLCV
jgi:hypothetical protein